MKETDFTIVVPVCGEEDLYRFKLILFPTIRHFFSKSDIFVITPRQSPASFHSSIFIIRDEELINSEIRAGWLKQQILKLLVHRFVTSHWYLVLDSDCFFTRHCSPKDFFVNDKARVNLSTGHDTWWKSASRFTGYAIPSPRCGVTPMLLHTCVVKELCSSLDVERAILSCNCTEYSLYWTYLHHFHTLTDYYVFSNQYSVSNHEIWHNSSTARMRYRRFLQLVTKNIEKSHQDSRTFLSLIQSTLTKEFSHISPYLQIDDISSAVRHCLLL